MKSKRKEKDVSKVSVVAQIFSLILSTIAIAYILGSAFPVVSADPQQCVSIYNSGATEIVHVPSGTTVAEYCRGKGTNCKEVACHSQPNAGTPAVSIIPAAQLVSSSVQQLRGPPRFRRHAQAHVQRLHPHLSS